VSRALVYFFAFGFMACGPDGQGSDGDAAEGGTGDGSTRGGDEGGERGGEDRGEWGDEGTAEEDGGEEWAEEGFEDEGDEWGEMERACFACLESTEACEAQWDACEENLGCQLLLDCPFACGATAECVAQCNDVIPSGVAPLTELYECLICNGGPCADACAAAALASYCG